MRKIDKHIEQRFENVQRDVSSLLEEIRLSLSMETPVNWEDQIAQTATGQHLKTIEYHLQEISFILAMRERYNDTRAGNMNN